MHILGIAILLVALAACRTGARTQTAASLERDGGGEVRWGLSGVDAGPTEPEAPPAVDSDGDGDGIADLNDACPSEPEDFDNFDDKDGCPDPDNDRDHIPDVNDKCPNEPETYNNFEDDDGCPDASARTRPAPRSRIKEGPIAFDDNSAAIRADTAAILDSIAAVIPDRPDIHEVTLEGHAEAYEHHPAGLSAARAEAVRRYLIKRGVRAGLIRPAWPRRDRMRSLVGGDDNDGRDRRRVDVGIAIPR